MILNEIKKPEQIAQAFQFTIKSISFYQSNW